MTNYVITRTNSISNPTDGQDALAITASGEHNIYVAEDGYVIAWGSSSSGISVGEFATDVVMIIDGLVRGFEYGIESLAVFSTDITVSGQVLSEGRAIFVDNQFDVRITRDGYVSGDTSGVTTLLGSSGVISNAGVVAGATYGMNLLGNGVDVVNSGEITAGLVAIGNSGSNTEIFNSGVITGDLAPYTITPVRLRVENSGQWHGDLQFTGDVDSLLNTGEISGKATFGDGVDTVRNSGDISGAVDLGLGDDLYDGRGGSAADVLGGAGRDDLRGGGAEDFLFGGEDADTLRGGAGDDALTGGAKADRLIGGGGADLFAFEAKSDSGVAANQRDRVVDFSRAQGDRIDLSGIDAVAGSGSDQDFTFIGTGTFTGVAGQLRYSTAGGDSVVEGDVNGDGAADFAILLKAVTTLAVGDFIL